MIQQTDAQENRRISRDPHSQAGGGVGCWPDVKVIMSAEMNQFVRTWRIQGRPNINFGWELIQQVESIRVCEFMNNFRNVRARRQLNSYV